MPPSTDMSAFKDALAASKQVVVLAGAGLSAGSGIPTFRSSAGLWVVQDFQKVASVEGFKEDPGLVWQFHHERRKACLKAEPNPAHRAIASLAIPSVRKQVLPGLSKPDSPPLLITQNFDSLSARALEALHDQMTPEEMKQAQESIIEMHGNVLRTQCTQCKHISVAKDYDLDPGDSKFKPNLPIDQLPRCGGPTWNGSNRYGRCGGLLRPGVVWFGEIPNGMGEIARHLNWTDFLIVVGTSSLVYPAAGFAETVKSRGGKVAVFNLEPSKADEDADFVFLGKCEELVPKALATE